MATTSEGLEVRLTKLETYFKVGIALAIIFGLSGAFGYKLLRIAQKEISDLEARVDIIRPIIDEGLSNLMIQEQNSVAVIRDLAPQVLLDSLHTFLVNGVGHIMTSVLDTSEFYSRFNRGDELWVLADGRIALPGTAYRTYLDRVAPNSNGQTPDLRGIFLRGKNYDRDVTKGNPNGDKGLGHYAFDSFKEHDHGINKANGTLEWYVRQQGGTHAVPPSGADGHLAGTSNTNYSISPSGGDETRPRNVTVNYFLRIN